MSRIEQYLRSIIREEIQNVETLRSIGLNELRYQWYSIEKGGRRDPESGFPIDQDVYQIFKKTVSEFVENIGLQIGTPRIIIQNNHSKYHPHVLAIFGNELRITMYSIVDGVIFTINATSPTTGTSDSNGARYEVPIEEFRNTHVPKLVKVLEFIYKDI